MILVFMHLIYDDRWRFTHELPIAISDEECLIIGEDTKRPLGFRLLSQDELLVLWRVVDENIERHKTKASEIG